VCVYVYTHMHTHTRRLEGLESTDGKVQSMRPGLESILMSTDTINTIALHQNQYNMWTSRKFDTRGGPRILARYADTRHLASVSTYKSVLRESKHQKKKIQSSNPLQTYENIHLKTTFMCPRSIAGVLSSQALPGYLITAPTSVCVPDVIGALAVWIQNQKKKG